MKNFISEIWELAQPQHCTRCTILHWFAGLVLLLVVAFLWSTVVKQIS